MKKLLGLLFLCGAIASPALAQTSPTETNLDQSAAQMEIRNARGNQLVDVSPEQARANELKRCENLPEFYCSDCEARISGQGRATGSVIGGGRFVESVTSMPESELESQLQSIEPVQLPRR